MSITERSALRVNKRIGMGYIKIMDAEQLREVIMLAEKKNYAVAAEQLFISQSALSRHISQLEDKLGVQLFDRSPRKVSLTRYGEALLPYAKNMISIEDDCLAEISRIKREESNNVRLGCVHGIATYGVMNLISGFIAENKDIALSIDNAESNMLKERLNHGQVDAIIIYNMEDDMDNPFKCLTLCEDRLVAVVPETHPLASRYRLSVKDLSDEECIIQDEDHLMGRLMSVVFRGSGVSIKRAPLNVRGVGTMELAAQGLGIAFELEMTAKKHDLSGVKIIPLESARKVRLELVWPKKICEAGSLFVSYMKKHSKKSRT